MTAGAPIDEAEIVAEIQSAGWLEDLPDVATRAVQAAGAALGAAWPDHGAVGVALVLADDATVRDLNRTWRGRNVATNVLSFPATAARPDAPPAVLHDGMPLELGDVILALETCRREAVEQSKTLGCHLVHLVVHGTLHLLGYDHLADDEAERMETLETRILAGLGIADPYIHSDVRADG